jgi:molybdopterin-containing oxidoreductase family iron-sulfur binding subunit
MSEPVKSRITLHDGHRAPEGHALSRRSALKLMAASAAFSSLAGCVPPSEEIVPYVDMPEGLVPGKPRFYATAGSTSGGGYGILVESHEGRPTKIEGNPDHPMSLGATDAAAQADILDLYDPARSDATLHRDTIAPWDVFVARFTARLRTHRAQGGSGLAVLVAPIVSPTLAAQIDDLQRQMPRAAVYRHNPLPDEARLDGTKETFGRRLVPFLHLDRAQVALFVDADVLSDPATGVRYARDFSRQRRARDGTAQFSRAYAVETATTITGASCDHRLALAPREIDGFVRALAGRLGVGPAAEAPRQASSTLDAVVADLRSQPGRGVIVGGRSLSPELHDLINRMNVHLGAPGSSISYLPPIDADPDRGRGLERLLTDIEAGGVETLVVLGANPAYSAPDIAAVSDAFGRVDFSVHHGLYADETARVCEWHVPAAHFLEDWSDVRAADGTASIVQPLIRPLKGGKSVHEIAAMLTGAPHTASHALVQATWRQVWQEAGAGLSFEDWWRRVLHDGTVPGTAFAAVPVSPRTRDDPSPPSTPPGAPPEDGTFELVLAPDPYLWDGARAANAWLQELPRPITKLVWENALHLSPADAAALEVSERDVVSLEAGERRISAPVVVEPGQAKGVATLHFGYGRTRAGPVGTGRGVSAYALRADNRTYTVAGARLVPTGGRRELLQTQHDFSRPDPQTDEVITLEDYLGHEATPADAPPASLYPERLDDTGYGWAMVIDESLCIGCSACVAACQAENNIPVVGPDEVANHRIMHWLRVDTHQVPDDPTPTRFQPVPCMQCETAPCEPVCPVEASVHDHEGLNDQVYNRCIGTRFCQSGCPYKVRRFNFYDYSSRQPQAGEGSAEGPSLLEALKNPDVTVRGRGVMEKCTYCVQRISAARRDADIRGGEIEDGALKTACQAVCPTEAIAFGNKNDADAEVSRLRGERHEYSLLDHLGTRPRTTYLKRVVNRSPALDTKGRRT